MKLTILVCLVLSQLVKFFEVASIIQIDNINMKYESI